MKLNLKISLGFQLFPSQTRRARKHTTCWVPDSPSSLRTVIFANNGVSSSLAANLTHTFNPPEPYPNGRPARIRIFSKIRLSSRKSTSCIILTGALSRGPRQQSPGHGRLPTVQSAFLPRFPSAVTTPTPAVGRGRRQSRRQRRPSAAGEGVGDPPSSR